MLRLNLFLAGAGKAHFCPRSGAIFKKAAPFKQLKGQPFL
ncbi:hypothetical protein B4098_2414 [Heyndrickxia coagulans]|uniref:Uncharacterized protein n=1 Tax=Heyndrickxia coagulans TaxID=1398 RepID=A0A150JNB4_HEYCO|nr:hypothetical protein B4098_2414 [Heyndrickxia coagulans]KYC58930.1 hypothetical protein B4099_2546 [Heyndrickxia coagulans]